MPTIEEVAREPVEQRLARMERTADHFAVFKKLSATELQRTCNHAVWGRITIDRIVGLLAWHDDNHLDQLKRPRR